MIKIPLNRAIQLLEKRLSEVDNSQTDLKALKSRLKIDIEAIFGLASTPSMTVIGLSTPIFDKPEEIVKCKTTFRQTIKGWIEFINDFHIIDQEKLEISEQEFKEKYVNLLKKWNELIPEYNQLLKDYENITAKYDDSLSEIEILKGKLNQNQNIGDIIKILFLGASPIDEVRLRLDEELRDIEIGLKMATLRESFDLKSKWAITTKSLQQAMLDENPTIVHFSGHGHVTGIAVEDSLGNSKLIENNAIGGLFDLFKENIKCVVLNSCYSESQAREIAKHIPFVIGMKKSVNDKAAIAFSVGFYSALGAGKDIKFAFKMGTVAIQMEGISGNDIPVLLG
ncbi:CHAT domain-containing protein [Lacinutrix undariae]